MSANYIQRAREILSKKIDVEPDLLDLYTLLVFTKGVDVELIDIHDAWAVWRTKTSPDHKSAIPFAHLSPEVQELDRPYMEAVAQTARELDL